MKIKGVFNFLTSSASSLRLVVFILLSLAVLLIAENFVILGLSLFSENSVSIRHLLGFFAAMTQILLGIIALMLCLCITAYILRILIKSKINFRRTGIILLHLGIPVVLAGYLAGKFGIDAEVQIPKGQSSNVIYHKNGRTERLDFSIRCDEFKVIYYDDGSPSEFISYLSFIKNGEIQKKSILRVNHPVRFEGVSLYQSGYTCEEAAIIKITDSSKVTWIEARHGDELKLDESVTIRTGHIISDLMNAGPAVELFIETPAGNNEIWILKNLEKVIQRKPDFLDIHPEFNPKLVRPFTFLLQDVNSSCSTGLSVRKDPGVTLAATGGIIFLIGMIMIFIPKHKYQDKKDGH
ncbi:MAG TPA: cytochrome c biogenesis protein ResB [Desulfomonilia bacterium]